MKKILWRSFKILLSLLLLGAFAFLIYLKPFTPEFWSERAKYERSLWFSEYGSEQIDAWRAAPSIARADSLFLDLPVNLQVGETGEDLSAWAYHLELKEGQKLLIEISRDTADLFFADLYFKEENGKYSSEATLKADSLAYPVLESGVYLLQIQGKMYEPFTANIELHTAPIYDIFPVAGKDNRAVQSFWGAPRDGGRRKHEGIDIFAKKGTPLLAVCDGEIRRVREGGLGGRTVWLYDSELDQSIYYAHLDEQLVSAGDYVTAGDTIGTVGNTGNARTTPPHLHLGIYVNGAVDPYLFVKRVAEKAEPLKNTEQLTDTLSITERPARMYFAPRKEAKANAVLVAETAVKVTAVLPDYLQIKAPNGRSYFVPK